MVNTVKRTDWNLFIRYEGCSKWIAYFYLETSNFKLAQKYSFHALEVLPMARNAKFQPMYLLLEGITVRWFGHSNKVLMNGRSKCLSGLVFPPSKECFQFWKKKKKSHGARSGEYGGWGKTVTFSFFKNAVTIAEVWAGALSCRRQTCFNQWPGVVSDNTFSVSSVLRLCSTFRWCFCPFSLALLLRLLHQRRRLHTKPFLYSKNIWQLLGVCCV